jgi:ComF family protein
MKSWERYLRYIFHPGGCWICHRGFGKALCSSCWRHLPHIAYPGPCRYCGQPALSISESCAACLEDKPSFDRLIVGQEYLWPWTDWISDIKFYAHKEKAQLLALYMAEQVEKGVKQGWEPPSVLIPVPLHRKRLQERGFNQAQLLAMSVGRILSVPVNTVAVTRIKETHAQSGLAAEQREGNVHAAFSLGPMDGLSGSHVAVVDDVVTTFNTVNSVSKLLKKRGVLQVTVISGCVA